VAAAAGDEQDLERLWRFGGGRDGCEGKSEEYEGEVVFHVTKGCHE
jgi:hypothetical protein